MAVPALIEDLLKHCPQGIVLYAKTQMLYIQSMYPPKLMIEMMNQTSQETDIYE
jgi:hypothetical protein